MATTPIYQHGTWGRVVAVDHDGTRIDRPADGQTPWTAPAWNWGEITRTHPDYPDVFRTIDLGTRTGETIMLPNDDARISPQWAALVEAGTITNEMLATLPPPLSEVKRTALATVTGLHNQRVAAGMVVAIGVTNYTIGITDAALASLTTILTANAGQPDDTETHIVALDGAPIKTTLGIVRARQPDVAAYVRGLKKEWSDAYAAITAAADAAAVGAAVEDYRGV